MSYPLDRDASRARSAWRACQNSLTQSATRDFAIEFAARRTSAMVHVSRLSEELVLWMSQSFGFIEIAERFCNRQFDHAAEEEPRRARLARSRPAASSA